MAISPKKNNEKIEGKVSDFRDVLQPIKQTKWKPSSIKLKIRLPNDKLPVELQKSSQDLELSVELAGSDIGLITDSAKIEQISNKVLEGLKEHFKSSNINSCPQISHCDKIEDLPLQK